MTAIAIIGGTGVDDLEGVGFTEDVTPETPYGPPSAPIRVGRYGAQSVLFLRRHGAPRSIPPHAVNYRANIDALRQLGATRIVAVNAVGGISAEMQPGRLVLPDQIIDYTWGREHTFDDGSSGELMHVDFTEPFDKPLRSLLLNLAVEMGIEHVDSATLGVTQGPRLETAAEVQRLERDGCDLVGMTSMPEASLAREAGIPYASICMVTNPAAGIGQLPITLEMMHGILEREVASVTALLSLLLLRA